jgi:hypothetical protein
MSSHRMHFWEWTKYYIMLDTSSQNEMLTHCQYVKEIPSFLPFGSNYFDEVSIFGHYRYNMEITI